MPTLKPIHMDAEEPTIESNNLVFNLNRFFGATLIVSGTTIGAGMLALPMTSAAAGFISSTWLLIGMWALMCLTALITLELNLYFGKGISIAGLAEQVLGKTGKTIASLALMLLFYALLAAYITGGTSLLRSGLESWLSASISFALLACAYTVVFGFFVNSCTKSVDYANRLLFFVKIAVFCVMVFCLAPSIKLDNLTQVPTSSWHSLWLAAPIFFTSFGFHGSIPSLVNYVGKRPKELRLIIILGSLLPLIVYLLWQASTLGVLTSSNIESIKGQGDVSVFINAVNSAVNVQALSLLTNIFAFLAIATSFLGVAIGLFDFLAEALKKSDAPQERLQTSILTFLPPLFFALFYPNGFITALGYAAIALSFLAVLLPAIIAFALRNESKFSQSSPLGNKVLLLSLILAAGLGMILIELLGRF